MCIRDRPNYALYRDDRPGRNAGVGTAIAVKYCVVHRRVVLPPRQNIEATAVELPGVLGGVHLVSAYKPPTAPVLDADVSVFSGRIGRLFLQVT